MNTVMFLVALSSVALHAQLSPKFDVVSIKTCKPGAMSPGGSSPGRLHIGCGILADTDNTGLIQLAYNRYAGGVMTSYAVIPIEGAPEWVHSETFEIDAQSERRPSMLMMEGPMMQALLEDRFRLKIHRETRQGPVYELTLAKGAPRLKPYQAGICTPVTLGRALPALSPGQRYCRNMVGPTGAEFEGGPLSSFAGLLNLIVDRPVIDRTGLTAYFEIHLKFSRAESAALRPAPGDPDAEARAPDVPGIFQAMQEQLGLKLTPARGPVDVLVIDHIERPSGN